MRQLVPGTSWSDAVYRAGSVLYEAGATAVWLFGSRACGREADRLTDFDLAIEGLPASAGAIARAARELGGRVDIIRMESAPAALRWGIARNRVFVPRVASLEATTRLRRPLSNSLAGKRIEVVSALVQEVAPRSAIDFGCGQGWLLAELAAAGDRVRLTGVDFDRESLERARGRIARAAGLDSVGRVGLLEGLITHRDPRYLGHDAATAIEVIEHLEEPQLAAFIGVAFAFVRPARIVVTTPNAEYNVTWFKRFPSRKRHPDHRFEWTRPEFARWAERVAKSQGYSVRFEPVGTIHPQWGPPTQLAVFDRSST